LPVVGAIAPPAETFSPAPRSGDRGIVDDKIGFRKKRSQQSSRLLGCDRMATVLAFASFDQSVRDAARPEGARTWRRAPRARGPSAPSAERARDPYFRSLALPVGARAPLRMRSRPQRRADGSVRSVGPTRPGRHRSTSGLRTWRRSARSASPDHLRGVATAAAASAPRAREMSAARAFSITASPPRSVESVAAPP